MVNSSVNSTYSDSTILRTLKPSVFKEEFKPLFGKPNENGRRAILIADAEGNLISKGYIAEKFDNNLKASAVLRQYADGRQLWVISNGIQIDEEFGSTLKD